MMNSLNDVYIDQIQDMYSADKQSRDAVQKLHEVVSDSDLKSAMKNGIEGIGQGMEILKGIAEKHGAKPDGEFCKGMEGLVKEVDAHVLDAEFGDDDVRDAMAITQYQRMTHYGLAGYGCLVAFAERLGHTDDADKLQHCLDNTYGGDRTMTDLATGGINRAAAE